MRKLILASLLALSLTFNAAANGESNLLSGIWVYATAQEPDPNDRSLQAMRYRAWLDLCFEYRAGVSCEGINPPKIKTFARDPFRPGLAGYYNGTDTVFIRRGLKYEEREEVIAHEMSHYLDKELGITNIPGFAREICFSEKRAWAVSDAFWIKMGYAPDSKKIVGAKWVNWYGHCTPLAAELYPDVYGV